MYNWFSKKDLSDKIIVQLGEVLGYDFSVDFRDLENVKDISSYKEPEFPLTGSSQYWMLKYIELLEKYNALAESK